MTTWWMTGVVWILTSAGALAGPTFSGDEIRGVAPGDPLPSFTLPTSDGRLARHEPESGDVVVLVYLSAEQRSSELAAIESQEVVRAIDSDSVRLLHVTADIVHKPYFERFREENSIRAPLALDAGRTLYGDLGLIVFPTTVVTDRQGQLVHAIVTRGSDYPHTLDVYIRHALGMFDDAALESKLDTGRDDGRTTRMLASRHRAAARLLWDKQLLPAAKQKLVEAIELDPMNLDAKLDLADLELAMGEIAEAGEVVATALEMQPENRRAKQIKGIVHFRMGDLAEAERVLREALELNPQPSRVHYYLGRIYEERGETERAMAHYKAALKEFISDEE